MAFQVLHSLAPPYLDQLVLVVGRRRLRSLTSHQLHVPVDRYMQLSLVSRCCIQSIVCTLCHLTFSHRLFSVNDMFGKFFPYYYNSSA